VPRLERECTVDRVEFIRRQIQNRGRIWARFDQRLGWRDRAWGRPLKQIARPAGRPDAQS